MTIYLKDDDSADMDRAYKVASRIEHTKIRDIITKSEIYYEPMIPKHESHMMKNSCKSTMNL